MLARRLLWLLPLVMLIAGVLLLRRTLHARDHLPPFLADLIGSSEAEAAPALEALAPRTQQPGSAAPASVLPVPSLPGSLQGTDVDGELHVDAQGAFVPDAAALRFFEYFLAALGERDEASLRALIAAEIEKRLPASARASALTFLDTYLHYRQEAGDLGRISKDPDDLHAAVDTLYALRRDIFGEKLADTLFAEEEAVRTHALERRLLLADTSLDESERKARLDALDRDLPEPLQRARTQASLPIDVRDEVANMRKQGATDDEVFAMREQKLGRDAAERLAALDRERADFQRRLDDFKARRAGLAQEGKLSPSALEAEVARLFERSFAPSERARASVLVR